MCSTFHIRFWICTIVCSLNLHPPVSCLPSPQLTLPEGTQPRWAHTLTACKMEESRVHATTFGGCPSYDPKRTDDSIPKLADTTVLEFGEQNTYHTMIWWHACPFTLLYCGFNRALIDIRGGDIGWLEPPHFQNRGAEPPQNNRLDSTIPWNLALTYSYVTSFLGGWHL